MKPHIWARLVGHDARGLWVHTDYHHDEPRTLALGGTLFGLSEVITVESAGLPVDRLVYRVIDQGRN